MELMNMKGFKELYAHIETNPIKLTLGKRTIDVTNKKSSFQLMRWILKQIEWSELPKDDEAWKKVIENYNLQMNEFLKQNTFPDKVFMITADHGEWDDGNYAFTKYKESISYQLWTLAKDGKPVDLRKSGDKAAMLKQFTDYVKAHPNEKVLLFMGLHGGKDWSARVGKESFTKEDFKKLANLGDNVQLDIVSCRSGYKLDGMPDVWGVSLGSNFEVWTSANLEQFLKAFEMDLDRNLPKGDFDGDGKVTYQEARMYQLLRYKDSFLPTFFQKKTPEGLTKKMRISESNPNLNDDRT